MTQNADPYAAVLALVESEHALVVAGDWEALDAIEQQRRRLMAAPPPMPSAGAGATLARCLEIQRRTTELLAAQVAELRRALGDLAHGRTAVKGYGGTPLTAAPLVDLEA